MSLSEETKRAKSVEIKQYDHNRLESRRNVLRFLIKWVGLTLLVKMDRIEGLENVPQAGPAILMINHIALIDPIMVMHAVPRNIVPLAKIEVYDYPVIGIFPRLWEVIPVKREEFDRRAVQQVFEVLKAGEIVLVAPEGTRSPQLQKGKEGVAYMASRSGVPVIPVAITGTPGFPALRFTNAWRGSGVTVKFGRPFKFRTGAQHATRDELTSMMDEAMYLLAGLLPPERRGIYSELERASQAHIEWVG
jgi:1-acyl-sn-glycerol-3-phosphate acyltransferase